VAIVSEWQLLGKVRSQPDSTAQYRWGSGDVSHHVPRTKLSSAKTNLFITKWLTVLAFSVTAIHDMINRPGVLDA